MVKANPQDDPLRVGGFLGHFFVLKELGEGKMCSVHLAFDVQGLRFVALKALHEHHRSVESFRKRLLREATVLEQFEHPHLLGLVENHAEDDPPYLAVEYLRGRPLDQHLRSEGGSLFVSEAFRYLGELASGLHFAHQRGVIHRDIRPDNVMIDHTGTAHLFDFGIAFAQDEIVKTQIGDIGLMGEYAPPEQMMGKPLSVQSDLYSLGAVIYQCLTGQKVVKSRTVEDLIQEIHQPVPPPSTVDSDVPAVLDAIMGKLLAKDPAGRYASAKDLLIDIGKLFATEDEAQRQALFGKVEDAQLAWARRAFEEGEYGKVLEYAEKAEGMAPVKRAAFYRLAARAHIAERRGDLALRMLEKASFSAPKDLNFTLDYALELIRQGEVMRAAKVLSEKDLPAKADQDLAAGLVGLLGEWNNPQVAALRERAAGAGGGLFGALGSFFGRGGKK